MDFGKHVSIIAIDGFGAAGKTTLAQALSAKLQNCPVIGLDDFCYPPSGHDGEWWGNNVQGYGVDWQRCRDQVLLPVSRGEAVRYQKLDWDDYSQRWTAIDTSASFLIVEGLHALHSGLQEFYTIKIWLDSPADTQLQRVAERDGETMIPHWIREFQPAARAYWNEHDPRAAADIILSMGDGPEAILQALRSAARDKAAPDFPIPSG